MLVLFTLAASTLAAALPSSAPNSAKGRPNISFGNITEVEMRFEGGDLDARAFSGASSYSFPDPSLIGSGGT